MEPRPPPDPAADGPEAATGLRAARWHLAVRPSAGGTRYAVYVHGRLITAGHATGQEALATAARILGSDESAAPPAEASI